MVGNAGARAQHEQIRRRHRLIVGPARRADGEGEQGKGSPQQRDGEDSRHRGCVFGLLPYRVGRRSCETMLLEEAQDNSATLEEGTGCRSRDTGRPREISSSDASTRGRTGGARGRLAQALVGGRWRTKRRATGPESAPMRKRRAPASDAVRHVLARRRDSAGTSTLATTRRGSATSAPSIDAALWPQGLPQSDATRSRRRRTAARHV